jgi:hypothetical protein
VRFRWGLSLSADIVARDGAGRLVIIENQFGPTDHGHFGQVVLYACEARADVVVWLAAGGHGMFPVRSGRSTAAP